MVQETQKWGRQKATERYGSLKTTGMKAKDMTNPQDPMDKQGPDYSNDTPNTWVRGANEDATTKPGFDKS